MKAVFLTPPLIKSLPLPQGHRATLLLFFGLLLNGCSSLLYYPTRHLHYDPARFQLKPKEMHFTSKDGTKLFGWHFKGKQPARATVVFFHGNAENLSSHYLNMIWILEHPFDLFIFDYQGYGRSEGSPSPKGTVDDGIAALEWAAAEGLPLVVFGQSLGGAIALRSVAEAKERLPIRFLAVDSTFSSYRGMGRQVMSRSWVTWPFQWLGWLLLSDQWAPKGTLASLSPLPLLVIHGENDRVVEIEMGEKVFAEAGEPKEFWRIPKGEHTDVFSRQDDTYKKDFLDRISKALR